MADTLVQLMFILLLQRLLVIREVDTRVWLELPTILNTAMTPRKIGTFAVW